MQRVRSENVFCKMLTGHVVLAVLLNEEIELLGADAGEALHGEAKHQGADDADYFEQCREALAFARCLYCR